jgi:DNA end-binding protein Ku
MPLRPFWKGYLKVALVTCSVSMTPAISDGEKVRFHTINRKTGNRVVNRYVDAVSGHSVGDEQQAKGYARAECDYVLIDDDELEAIGLESTHTIDIQTFAPSDSIDWIWYDRGHYLTPNDAIGEEAFSVIRDAMKATDMVGGSKLVIYGRERAVMLKPHDKGIVLWTLRYGDEVRNQPDYIGAATLDQADRKAVDRVSGLIERHRTAWSPTIAQDPVQQRLLDIIESKKRSRKFRARSKTKTEPTAPARNNVVDIMDALQKSVAADRNHKRR